MKFIYVKILKSFGAFLATVSNAFGFFYSFTAAQRLLFLSLSFIFLLYFFNVAESDEWDA